MKVRLKCYVPKADDGRKVYDEKSISLGSEFVFTVREYEAEHLEIVSEIRKYAGSWFNPVWTIAVFNVASKDPTPIFVVESEIEVLKERLKQHVLKRAMQF